MQHYSQINDQVRVTVKPVYLENQTSPRGEQFLWAYHIQIKNLGTRVLTLKKKYWKIVDSLGHIKEVWGDGVVGEFPVLKKGEVFEYTSGVSLNTSSGFMSGFYLMEIEDGEQIQVTIPNFSLDTPQNNQSIH